MDIELSDYTIRNLMEFSFDKFGSTPAFGFVGDLPRSYDEVQQKVTKLAYEMMKCGINKGDRIAILGDNSPNWVIAYLATTIFAAVAVPILPGFTDSDTRHILRNSESVALFIASNQRAKIEDMEISSIHTIIALEDFSIDIVKKDHLKYLEKSKRTVAQKTAERVDEMRAQLPTPKPEDLAAIIYTSGTTGNSKGVMLTHYNITTDVVNSIKKFPINNNDRFLSILPLSHTFEATGGMMCPLAVGSTIFYMRGLPTPQKLLLAMESVRPTAVLTVPLVVDKIYRKRILPKLQDNKIFAKLMHKPFFRKQLHKMAGKKLHKSLGGALRFFMFGGASLNHDVELFLRDAEISYSTGYGMTETSPILTINPFGKVKVGSCGQSIPNVDIKISDPNPENGIGEILVKGPNVMQGYFNNEQATKDVLLEDGWLRTGDLGYLDDENYLFIKGRSKNVIIGPSGENIFPENIEQVLTQNIFLQEVVVYEEDKKLIAKVYMDYDALDAELEGDVKNDAKAEEQKKEILESIRREVNEQLPQFSRISKIIEQPDVFEKTPTNKVKRYLYIPKKKE